MLIVDDNRDAANSLAMLIRGMGHQVEVCGDGRDAVEAARRLRADVVFLDLIMPQVDGFEVARRLRQDPLFERTLIVAVTGVAADEQRQRSREAGIDYYPLKPAAPRSSAAWWAPGVCRAHRAAALISLLGKLRPAR